MNIIEAIDRADSVRPNAIEPGIKAQWLKEFDATLQKELTGKYEESDDLFMDFPKDEIYPLYLMALIDNANEETTLYANDYAVAENAISDARRWYWREHKPYKEVTIKT